VEAQSKGGQRWWWWWVFGPPHVLQWVVLLWIPLSTFGARPFNFRRQRELKSSSFKLQASGSWCLCVPLYCLRSLALGPLFPYRHFTPALTPLELPSTACRRPSTLLQSLHTPSARSAQDTTPRDALDRFRRAPYPPPKPVTSRSSFLPPSPHVLTLLLPSWQP
jgi:hypothetical protein